MSSVEASDNDGGKSSHNFTIVVMDKTTGAGDTVIGNISDARSNVGDIRLKIEDFEFDYNRTYTGRHVLEILGNSRPLIRLNYTFSNETKLDFRSLEVNETMLDGRKGIVVRGLANVSNKTLYLNKSASSNAVCMIDQDIDSMENFTSDCSGQNEMKILCDDSMVNGYLCRESGGLFEVSGMKHSAVLETYVAPSEPSSPQPDLGVSSSGGSSSSGYGGTQIRISNHTENKSKISIDNDSIVLIEIKKYNATSEENMPISEIGKNRQKDNNTYQINNNQNDDLDFSFILYVTIIITVAAITLIIFRKHYAMPVSR